MSDLKHNPDLDIDADRLTAFHNGLRELGDRYGFEVGCFQPVQFTDDNPFIPQVLILVEQKPEGWTPKHSAGPETWVNRSWLHEAVEAIIKRVTG